MASHPYSIVLEKDGRVVRRINNVSEAAASKILAFVDGFAKAGGELATISDAIHTLIDAGDRALGMLGRTPRKRISSRRR